MCGIAGIIGSRTDAEHEIGDMLAALRHRGPDGSGTFHDRDVTLGHCRLAILDPSPAARQPMTDSSERFVCVFNGAIYNFTELRRVLLQRGIRFRSSGDTEVLVEAFAAWGPACLDRLNGMFAFAIYDKNTRSLFCARDRLGVKPFVYTSTGDAFAFASEHKALIAAGLASRRWSPNGVYEFIAQGHVSSDGSLFADIKSLPPGHYLVIDAERRPRIGQWWTPDCEVDDRLRDDEISSEIRALVEDATTLRLRSDVPVGTHLSGGLDSSAITMAAASRSTAPLTAFTGAFTDHPEADERRWSRLVAAAAGVHPVEVELDVEGLADVFHRVVWQLDEPVVGPGVLPQQLVYDAAAAAGVKVVLTGHGGDELFGGYLRHRAAYYKQRLHTGGPARRLCGAVELGSLLKEGGMRLTQAATVSDSDLDPEFLAAVDPEVRRLARRGRGGFDSVAELMRWDLQHYLPGLLHAEDRISMASSIESRAPLLDYRLVHAATRLPEDRHFRSRVSKPVLRDAVAPWLPPVVAARRDKKGFPTPLDQWKRQPRMRQLVEDLVARPASSFVFQSGYLSRPASMTAGQLWTVMLLKAWTSALDTPLGAAR